MGEKNKNSDSILILVLGVLGFLFPIVGVLAIVFYKKFENEGRELDDMAKVGYDLYVKILNQAVSELRGQKQKEYKEIKIDVALNCFIPENYIQSADERFKVYSNLKQISSTKKKVEILNEIQKTYGEIPLEIQNLANVALIRNTAREFDVKRVSIDRNRCQAEFYDKTNMLSKNLTQTLKDLDLKAYYSPTGIIMNFALSEYSVKRKLELVCEFFESSLKNNK